MVNETRLRQTFLELVSINSPPGEEREAARLCSEMLREAGFLCQTDAAGNVLAQKAGTVDGAPRIFYSAHTDTVQPTEGLVVREEDGVFRTSGDTILGADDKAALSEIIEAVRVLAEREIPHGDLQIVFSTREEVGLRGAKAVAPEVLAGSIGFVFDASGPTGAIITGAPTHDCLEVNVRGRPAHAGFAPENGVSALQIACRAISRMNLGRIDLETTANVGKMYGGSANNIVAEHAWLLLEARSRNVATLDAQVRHMRTCFEEAAQFYGGQVLIEHRRDYDGYNWSPDDLPLRIAAEAWTRLDRVPVFRPTGGGSDANVFNARGIPSVVLSCGYLDAHTENEHVALSDMVAAAEWAVEIARVAAEGSAD
jgi:tripeptide aminopeptidase